MSRSARYTHSSFEQMILRPIRAKGYQYKVFFHTWVLKSGEKYTNPWSDEYDIDLDRLDYLYIPATKVVAEQYPDFDLAPYNVHGDPWGANQPRADKAHTHQNYTLRMSVWSLMSQYRVTQLWKNENCFRVMYTRPDVTYVMPFKTQWLEYTDVIMPNFGHWPMNDRFALGPPEKMLVYGERLLNATEYAKTKKLHSETYLYDMFHDLDWPVKTVNFNFRVTRTNGKMTTVDLPHTNESDIVDKPEELLEPIPIRRAGAGNVCCAVRTGPEDKGSLMTLLSSLLAAAEHELLHLRFYIVQTKLEAAPSNFIERTIVNLRRQFAHLNATHIQHSNFRPFDSMNGYDAFELIIQTIVEKHADCDYVLFASGASMYARSLFSSTMPYLSKRTDMVSFDFIARQRRNSLINVAFAEGSIDAGAAFVSLNAIKVANARFLPEGRKTKDMQARDWRFFEQIIQTKKASTAIVREVLYFHQ